MIGDVESSSVIEYVYVPGDNLSVNAGSKTRGTANAYSRFVRLTGYTGGVVVGTTNIYFLFARTLYMIPVSITDSSVFTVLLFG